MSDQHQQFLRAGLELLFDGPILRRMSAGKEGRAAVLLQRHCGGLLDEFVAGLRRGLSESLAGMSWGLLPVRFLDAVWDRWLCVVKGRIEPGVYHAFSATFQGQLLEPFALEHQLYGSARQALQEELIAISYQLVVDSGSFLSVDAFSKPDWSALLSAPTTFSIDSVFFDLCGEHIGFSSLHRSFLTQSHWLSDAILSRFLRQFHKHQAIVEARRALEREGLWLAPDEVGALRDKMLTSNQRQFDELRRDYERLMGVVWEYEADGLTKYAVMQRRRCEGILLEMTEKQDAIDAVTERYQPFADALGAWQEQRIGLERFAADAGDWFTMMAAEHRESMESMIALGVGAAWRASHLPDVREVSLLLQALQGVDQTARREAVVGLGSVVVEESYRVLVELIKDKDPEIRWRAIEAIGKHGDSNCVPLLLNGLSDADESVRWITAQTLAPFADPRAFEGLCHALIDENDLVRWRAIEALSLLSDKRAVRPFMRLLERDPSRIVRRAAAKGLGALGGERAKGALRIGMEDDDPSVREAAHEALRHWFAKR